jgi:WD40 repeat protein
LGHKNNVSSLIFDPVTSNLITNSEDKTVRVWNTETKTEVLTVKKDRARNWMLAIRSNGTLLASGHD